MKNLEKSEQIISKVLLILLLLLLLNWQKYYFSSAKNYREKKENYSSQENSLAGEALIFKGFISEKKPPSDNHFPKKEKQKKKQRENKKEQKKENKQGKINQEEVKKFFKENFSLLSSPLILEKNPVLSSPFPSPSKEKREKLKKAEVRNTPSNHPSPLSTPSFSKKEREETENFLSSSQIIPWRKKEKIDLPIISASSAIIIGLNDNFIFFQKEPKKILPIASLSKLMTSLIVLDNLPLEEKIIIPKEISLIETSRGTNLLPGEKISVKDLLAMALIASSNQAAAAFSIPLPDIASRMQKKAKELNLNNTFFAEPTGLSSLNRASAEDLFKLTKYIWFNKPEIFKITKIKEKEIISSKRKIQLTNINPLAKRNDFLGGKTGYTNQANGTLISIFQWKEKSEPAVIIVLNSKSRVTDTLNLLNWLKKSYY